MDTYPPRTIEQLHACTRQKQRSAAAVAKQQQEAKGVLSATAVAAAAAARSSKSAAAASAERADGRKPAQLRSTFVQSGVVSAAVGSAYVERQGTKVLCSIYGPRASSKLSTPYSERGFFAVDVKYAPFAQTNRRARRGAASDADERRLQTQLSEALSVSIHLESFPKAVLEAFVVVLQDDGAVFSACVSAVSLALADAGIMLYDVVTACQAIALDGQLLLDPSGEEEAKWAARAAEAEVEAEADGAAAASAPAAASVVLAYMPNLRQISSITQAGPSTTEQVTQLTHLCIAGCEQISGLMRDTLVNSAKQHMQVSATQPPA